MTKTEEFIILKKDELKDYIKNEVDNYNNPDTNIWGQLMNTILPKIQKFEKEVVSTFSSEFDNNDIRQVEHHFEMRKHLIDVNRYYDKLISDWVKNAR